MMIYQINCLNKKEEVCTHLTIIMNTSLLNGTFPDPLKIAIV